MVSEQTLDAQRLLVSKKIGLLAGMLAGLIMTALLVALRFTVDAPGLPEVMADWLTMVMPPAVFDFVLERLQVASKPLMFASLLVGQVVTQSAGTGSLFRRFRQDLRDNWRHVSWYRMKKVAGLYRRAFEKRMGEIEELYYEKLGWGDDEAKEGNVVEPPYKPIATYELSPPAAQ